MHLWPWFVAGAFLVAGFVLAVATTTSNRMRWAVMAPAMWGTGMLIFAVVGRDWTAVAVCSGMYFYAAINYWNIRRSRA